MDSTVHANEPLRKLQTAGWSKSKAEIEAASYNYEEAIKLFSECLAKRQDIYAYIGRGNVYGSMGDFHKAIADYTEAIKHNQEDNSAHAMAYNNRGVAYSHLGQNDSAISDFKKSLEICSSTDLARNNLESVKMTMMDADKSTCGVQPISGLVV